jgi:flagella basal body P-ring formation protein FlgA
VQAVPMVRAGELITITLTQGSVQIKSVARAMENGAFGESIRVKNEETRDVYQVTMTGPQAAEMEPGALSR